MDAAYAVTAASYDDAGMLACAGGITVWLTGSPVPGRTAIMTISTAPTNAAAGHADTIAPTGPYGMP
jgi:hypothetical protein